MAVAGEKERWVGRRGRVGSDLLVEDVLEGGEEVGIGDRTEGEEGGIGGGEVGGLSVGGSNWAATRASRAVCSGEARTRSARRSRARHASLE